MILLAHLNLPGFTFIDVNDYLTFRPNVAMFLAFSFQIYYIILNELVGVSISRFSSAHFPPSSLVSPSPPHPAPASAPSPR